jgi:hypothetical protein
VASYLSKDASRLAGTYLRYSFRIADQLLGMTSGQRNARFGAFRKPVEEGVRQ